MPIESSSSGLLGAIRRSRSRSVAEVGEIAAGDVQPAFQGGHAHQPANRKVGDSRPLRPVTARSRSGANRASPPRPRCSLPTTPARPPIRRPPLDSADQPLAIGRWIIAAAARPADLVALQVADQVPADRQFGQRVGPVPKLLRAALAELGAAGLDQGPDFRRPTYFVTASRRTSSAARPAREYASAVRKADASEVFGNCGGH